MNIESLQSFIAVVEHKNFSQAAQKIYISQPTLSRQIRAIEKELEVTLFERGSNTLILTDIGVQCLDLAKAIVHEWEEMHNLSAQYNSVISGRLSVGYANERAGEVALPVLKEMSQLYPNLEICTSYTPVASMLQALRLKDLDLAITGQQSVVHHADINYHVLQACGWMVVLPANHHLAAYESLTLEDIHSERLIMKIRSGFSEEYDAFFEEARAHNVEFATVREEETTENLFLQIQLGRGIGCMGGGLISRHIKDLRTIPLVSGKKEHGLVAAWRKGDNKFAVRTFIDLLSQMVQNIDE